MQGFGPLPALRPGPSPHHAKSIPIAVRSIAIYIGFMDFILGTAQLTRDYGLFRHDFEQGTLTRSVDLLTAAAEGGFVAIDTAPVYGDAEEHIGIANVALPVITKLDPKIPVSESLDRSKKFLRRKRLDAVLLHEELILSPAQRRVLLELENRKGEDIVSVGSSVYSVEEFHRANENPQIDIIQLPFNVFDRRFSEDFLSSYLAPNKRVIARSVFLQGVLLSSAPLPAPVAHLQVFVDRFSVLAELCGVSLVDAALGFACSNSLLTAVILGAGSKSEVLDFSGQSGGIPSPCISQSLETLELPPWEFVDPRTWKSSEPVG